MKKIRILFNDTAIEIEAGLSVEQFIGKRVQANQPFAIAINQTFIPKNSYATTTIKENDDIEIVSPMQGG